jgi:hypothetical protein
MEGEGVVEGRVDGARRVAIVSVGRKNGWRWWCRIRRGKLHDQKWLLDWLYMEKDMNLSIEILHIASLSKTRARRAP